MQLAFAVLSRQDRIIDLLLGSGELLMMSSQLGPPLSETGTTLMCWVTRTACGPSWNKTEFMDTLENLAKYVSGSAGLLRAILTYDCAFMCYIFPFCSEKTIDQVLGYGFDPGEWYYLPLAASREFGESSWKGYDCCALSWAMQVSKWSVVEYLIKDCATLKSILGRWPIEEIGPLWLLSKFASLGTLIPMGINLRYPDYKDRAIKASRIGRNRITKRVLDARKDPAEIYLGTADDRLNYAFWGSPFVLFTADDILHVSVSQSDDRFTSLLLAAGADTNVLDSKGNTPLTRLLIAFCATQGIVHNDLEYVENMLKTAELLIQRGAHLSTVPAS